MSKKYSLIINLAMVIIGIIGMLLYFFIESKPTAQPQQVQQVAPEIPMENITVAVAQKDLTKGTRLTSGDFKLETLKVATDGNEKQTLAVADIDTWMLKSDVAAGSKIPVSVLVEPGSEEYIMMSVKPGSIVYGFSIKQSDSYLFTNARAGSGLDIYLSYSLRQTDTENGGVSITSTNDGSNEINDRHFKLLLKDKKILSIQTTTNKAVVGMENPLQNEGYVLVELMPDEVRTLKGLDGAKFYIFPTTENMNKADLSHSVLVGDEGQWPIDNRPILSTEIAMPAVSGSERVKEYRGVSASTSSE